MGYGIFMLLLAKNDITQYAGQVGHGGWHNVLGFS